MGFFTFLWKLFHKKDEYPFQDTDTELTDLAPAVNTQEAIEPAHPEPADLAPADNTQEAIEPVHPSETIENKVSQQHDEEIPSVDAVREKFNSTTPCNSDGSETESNDDYYKRLIGCIVEGDAFDRIHKLRLIDYVGRIRSAFLYLDAAESSKNFSYVPSTLQALTYPFSKEPDRLFLIAQVDEREGLHLLYVGFHFHVFSGNYKEAVRWGKELAHRYELMGDMEKYRKYMSYVEKYSQY